MYYPRLSGGQLEFSPSRFLQDIMGTIQHDMQLGVKRVYFVEPTNLKANSRSPRDAAFTVSRLTDHYPPMKARATQELASPTPLPVERRSLISIPPRHIVHHVIESPRLIDFKERSINLLLTCIFCIDLHFLPSPCLCAPSCWVAPPLLAPARCWSSPRWNLKSILLKMDL